MRFLLRYLFVFVFLLILIAASSQPADPKLEYINKFKSFAIEEMYKYKIPASITLAQGILESGSGMSPLALNANNHFGIKCHKEWSGKTYYQDDDEINECFRKYKKATESFEDHSQFLSTRERYEFLFDLDITDYKGWAYGLKKAGYATNPKYPELLITIIEEYNLHELDKSNLPENFTQPKHSKPKKTVRSRKKDKKEDFSPIAISHQRNILENNGVKYVYAVKFDSYERIAKEFNIYTWQLYTYNEVPKSHQPSEGDIVYLEKKKNKGSKKFVTVEDEKSLLDISQKYGVKLSKILKYNSLKDDSILQKGQKIRLRK